MSAGISWGAVDLSVDAFNVLDARYAALEYATQASWTPATMLVTTPSRAFSAGAPLSVLATLRLLVSTDSRAPPFCARALASASTVVPLSRNTESPSRSNRPTTLAFR